MSESVKPVEWSVPVPSLQASEEIVITEDEAIKTLAELLESGWAPEIEAALVCAISAIGQAADAARARLPQDATSATHPAPLTAVERADVVEARNEVIEEIAKHFDERGRALHHDIFAITTSRSKICRTAAKEIRALKAPRS